MILWKLQQIVKLHPHHSPARHQEMIRWIVEHFHHASGWIARLSNVRIRLIIEGNSHLTFLKDMGFHIYDYYIIYYIMQLLIYII